MLEILESIATKMLPFRKLSYLLAVALVGVIVAHLFQPTSQAQLTSPYAVLSFIGFIWLLLFNILLAIFHNIPSIEDHSEGLFVRVKIKLKRFAYYFIALLFIGLTVVIAFLTLRLLRV